MSMLKTPHVSRPKPITMSNGEFYSTLRQGDTLVVRYTSRGSRIAEVTRTVDDPDYVPFSDPQEHAPIKVYVKTYSPKKDAWSSERKLHWSEIL